jgi:hypothetical protein
MAQTCLCSAVLLGLARPPSQWPPSRRWCSVAAKPCPSRDIWLLAHADQIKLARVATVIKWVEGVIAGSARI